MSQTIRWNLISAEEHAEADEFDTLNAACVAWSSDEQTIAVGSYAGRVGVYNSKLRHEINQWELRGLYGDDVPGGLEEIGMVNCIAWSPDGSQLAIGIDYSGWRLLDAKLTVVLAAWGCDRAAVNGICWSPDGTRVAAACAEAQSVGRCCRVFDIASRQELLLSTLDQAPGFDRLCHIVAWSPDGSVLAAGFDSAGLSFVNVKDWTCNKTFACDMSFGCNLAVWNPAGTHFVVGVQDDKSKSPKSAQIITLSTFEHARSFTPFSSCSIQDILWSSSGSRLAFGSPQGAFKMFDVSSGQLLVSWGRRRASSMYVRDHGLPTTWCMSANLAWTRLAVGYDDGVIEIYEMRPAVACWLQVRLIAAAIYKPNDNCPLSRISSDLGRYIIDTIASYL